ncbi:hypothetical protein SHIRM173S_01767 [Streptomyces hirsutus]
MLPEVRPTYPPPWHTNWNINWVWLRISEPHVDVEGVAGIAVVAAAHSDGYGPPAISSGCWPHSFPHQGQIALVGPVEVIGHRVCYHQHQGWVLRSLAGEGTALARQDPFSAVYEMTPPQRVAAGEVIGQALAESDHLPDLKTQVIGELWAPRSAHRLARPACRPQVGRSGWTESLPRRLDQRLNVCSSGQPRRARGTRAGTWRASPAPYPVSFGSVLLHLASNPGHRRTARRRPGRRRGPRLNGNSTVRRPSPGQRLERPSSGIFRPRSRRPGCTSTDRGRAAIAARPRSCTTGPVGARHERVPFPG